MATFIEYTRIEGKEVMVLTDDREGTVMSFKESAGPIIAHQNRKECERIFIEALKLSDAVRNFIYFKQYGKFPSN